MFEGQLFSVVRDGKRVDVPFNDLTIDEKTAIARQLREDGEKDISHADLIRKQIINRTN